MSETYSVRVTPDEFPKFEPGTAFAFDPSKMFQCSIGSIAIGHPVRLGMKMPDGAKTQIRSETGYGDTKNLWADVAGEDGCVKSSFRMMADIVDVSVIENGGKKKVVVVYFGNGTTQKAVLCDNDEFSLEQGISVCITKHLLDHVVGHGSSLYNKVIDRGLKVYKNRIKAEETKAREAAEEKARRERKLAKKREKSAKRAAAKREDQINILSAAIQRAFSNINGTSDEAVG